jgi:hypothetical protein
LEGHDIEMEGREILQGGQITRFEELSFSLADCPKGRL